MAIPRLITVTGTVLSPAGAPVAGAVLTFNNNPMVRDSATDDVMPANQSITQTTGANGEISLAVPCTDDPAFTPSGWTWMLTLTVPGSPTEFYPVSVPYAAPGATVKLSQLLPAASSSGMTLYATLTQLAGYLPLAGGTLGGQVLMGDRFRLSATGGMDWAPSGGGYDLNLYRAGVGLLQTDYTFNAAALRLNGVDLQGLLDAKQDKVTMTPAEAPLAGWSFDPIMVQAATILPTSGVSHVVRVRATSSSISNILLHFTVAGTGLVAGQCFATLHNDAGVQIAASADQSTNWASSGLRYIPLTGAPVAVTKGAWYKVRFWFNGTTGPTVSRAVNSNTVIVNAGMSAPNFRFATADTGLTTLAGAPTTIGTQTGGNTAWWVGLS